MLTRTKRRAERVLLLDVLGGSTERPGDTITYTSNWPHEPLVGNTPTGAIFMWTFISIFVLLAGIGALVWYYAREFDIWRRDIEPREGFRATDLHGRGDGHAVDARDGEIFLRRRPRCSSRRCCSASSPRIMRSKARASTACRWPNISPTAVTRTWHTQLAVLWIATAWLAPGSMSRRCSAAANRNSSASACNFLFVSLLVIVVGSFAGEWLAINRMMPGRTLNFWFGHQGYEYLDLGRFWQIYLFVGLLLWVALVLRGLWPALQEKGRAARSSSWSSSRRSRSACCSAPGCIYGEHTHISIMEYWRWWVVHLWVEGIFEVFATAIVSALFVAWGWCACRSRRRRVLRRDDHLPRRRRARHVPPPLFQRNADRGDRARRVFSALEVVPLMVVGFEAYSRAKHRGIARLAEALPLAVHVLRQRAGVESRSARACSASSSIRRSRSTTCRG